nr:AgmX/PglI C-terminal domain-containing protein [Deltaproteobacteria bacterium]
GPRLGTDPGPIVKDPTHVSSQPTKTDNASKVRITLRPLPPQGPGTTLTVEMVLDRINTVYMPNLQRCYRKGLLGDASLAGKIQLSFTVTERGGLDDIEARGVSSEVDSCVSTAMSGWKFAIPRDKDGAPTDQGFRMVLALAPS